MTFSSCTHYASRYWPPIHTSAPSGRHYYSLKDLRSALCMTPRFKFGPHMASCKSWPYYAQK